MYREVCPKTIGGEPSFPIRGKEEGEKTYGREGDNHRREEKGKNSEEGGRDPIRGKERGRNPKIGKEKGRETNWREKSRR